MFVCVFSTGCFKKTQEMDCTIIALITPDLNAEHYFHRFISSTEPVINGDQAIQLLSLVFLLSTIRIIYISILEET